jgi:peptidoglycan/LPS O-acetylase OafA/YrhL
LLMGSHWKLNYLSYHQNQLWHWLLLQNWFPIFYNDWISAGRTPILDHLWLVALVCQFALIWGLLVYLFNRKTLIFIGLFFILLSIILRNIFVSQGLHFSVSYIFTFARLDTVCIGTLIALLLTEEKGKVILEKSAIPVFIISFILLVATIVLSRSLSLKDAYFIRWGYSLLAFLFGAVLLIALSEKNPLQSFFKQPWLTWFGRYSYGIYMLHWFFYLLLTENIAGRLTFISNTTLKSLATSAIITGFVLLSATTIAPLYARKEED